MTLGEGARIRNRVLPADGAVVWLLASPHPSSRRRAGPRTPRSTGGVHWEQVPASTPWLSIPEGKLRRAWVPAPGSSPGQALPART